MKRISATEFSAHCSAFVQLVHVTREPLLITKRGKPWVKLMPAGRANKQFLGRLRGVLKVVGDIESPVYAPEAWESMR